MVYYWERLQENSSKINERSEERHEGRSFLNGIQESHIGILCHASWLGTMACLFTGAAQKPIQQSWHSEPVEESGLLRDQELFHMHDFNTCLTFTWLPVNSRIRHCFEFTIPTCIRNSTLGGIVFTSPDVTFQGGVLTGPVLDLCCLSS